MLDISQKNLDNLIESASNNVENSTWYNPLCHLFHLSVGDSVYSVRKYVLERLAEHSKGEIIYGNMIQTISAWEREKGAKHSYPSYKSYPKSIQDAKKYFCLKNIDYVTEQTTQFDTVSQLKKVWHKLRGYS
ncbi:MAG: hypothetical protein JW922_10225 [Paludibacteraceae bacterium]|nr:hypothetical protein [Paludibacteraceae bacterium]